jgi:hypothetical protein
MTVVNPKSISGITSITTASGSDNLLTIHTSDANNTERLRIDSTGTTKIVTGIVTTLTATTGIVTTFEATTGNITTLRAPTGIVTTLTTNTLTANSTTKVGSGITLSPDGDIFATGITTVGNRIDVISSENTLGILTSTNSGANLDLFDNDTQSRIRTVDGRLHLYSDFGGSVADSSIRFFVDGSNEKARILSTGGITFNGDTATANALDDYEEGDYLPNFTVQSGSVTLDSNQKTLCYTKIGRQVTIIGSIKIASVSSPSGVLRAALPFARGSQTEQAERTMGNIMVINAAVNNANEFTTYPDGGSDSYIEIISISGTSINRNGGQNMQANTTIYVNYTYFAAS